MRRVFVFSCGCLLACGPSGATSTDAGSKDAALRDAPAHDDGSRDGAIDDAHPHDGHAGDASDGAAACAKHLSSGFTNVVATTATDPNRQYFGAQVAMALDENDDPMFAYLTEGASVLWNVMFTRWDPCKGAFTAPIVVDKATYGIGTSSGERQVAIAYDTSTKLVGIVYSPWSKPGSTGDGNPFVKLATVAPPATAFTLEVVSTNLDSVSGTSYASIAMANGTIYIAYNQSNYHCTDGHGTCTGVQFLTSTTMPVDAGASDGGPSGPYYFNAQTIQYAGAPAQSRANVSVAIDADGKVGVAFYEPYTGTGVNYTTTMLYWRNDMASAVAVTDSNNVQNDFVDLTLRYEGDKPSIAGHLVAASPATYDLIFEASKDGVKWAAPVQVPRDATGTTVFTSSLALDGAGHAVIASQTGSGMPKCADPYVALSIDDGMSWAACVSNVAKGYTFADNYLNAAFGSSRLKGKLMLGFQNGESTPAATEPDGVWYYQSP